MTHGRWRWHPTKTDGSTVVPRPRLRVQMELRPLARAARGEGSELSLPLAMAAVGRGGCRWRRARTGTTPHTVTIHGHVARECLGSSRCHYQVGCHSPGFKVSVSREGLAAPRARARTYNV